MADIRITFERDSAAVRRSSTPIRDPVECLAFLIKRLVQVFGPDAHKTIRASVEQDRDTAEKLAKVRECLQESHVEAKSVEDLWRQFSGHSWSFVIPMRRNMKLIADALEELQSPDVFSDGSAVREIFGEIGEAASEAVKTIAVGQKKLGDLSKELSAIRRAHADRQRARQDAADEARRQQEQNSQLIGKTVVNACVSGGCAVGLAVIPPLPPLAAAAAGVAAFSGIQVAVLKDDQQARQAREEEIDQAEQEAKISEAVVKTTERAIACTQGMEQDALSHQRLWAGIDVAAREAAKAPLLSESAQKLLGHGLDGLRWCGEQLLEQVQVIDEYLFCLSKTESFPPNFDIRAVIGSEAYSRLQREAAEYRKQAKPTRSDPLLLGV